MRLIGLYVAYAILSSVAVLMLKTSASAVRWPIEWTHDAIRGYGAFAVAGIVYGASFGTWAVILATTPVSLAYPVCVSLTLLVTTLVAVLFLNEKIHLVQAAGMAVVVLGIVMIMRPWALPPST